jgi:hypothetical protein
MARWTTRTGVLFATLILACLDLGQAIAAPSRLKVRAVIVALAKGLEEGHGNTQLMTIHPGIAFTSALDAAMDDNRSASVPR